MAATFGKGLASIALGVADHARTAEAVDEAALVRGAMAGDRSAWQALIARHDRKVLLSLLARGIAPDRARDLAQETWIRLIENQRAGRLERLVLPALAIVQAGYLATSQWRREGRREDDGEAALAGLAGGEVEQQAIDRQRLHQVSAALAKVPARSREVFEFVYQHPELDYAEAARRLSLSVQRVKQIVCDVRKQLRAALQEERR